MQTRTCNGRVSPTDVCTVWPALASCCGRSSSVDIDRIDSCANKQVSREGVVCCCVYSMTCDTLTSCCGSTNTNAIAGISSYADVHMSRQRSTDCCEHSMI